MTEPVSQPAARPVSRARRQRVIKRGRIAYANGTVTTDAMLRDVSATGARVWTALLAEYPGRFELRNETDGTRVSCELVWRRGGEAGVRFTGEVVPIRAAARPAA